MHLTMVQVCLILISAIINSIYATNENIVKTDQNSYIEIDSHLNPTFNTTYGSLQILDSISIEFNLIYHAYDNSHNTTTEFQNIFSIESSTFSNDNIIINNDIHCTQYASIWLLPSDNSLYFSLLNDNYCLIQSLNPIEPNIPYSITIKYNISNIYIAINDSIIINDLYTNENHEIDTINIYTSSSQSSPACITLYDIYIFTSPYINDIILDNSNRLNMDSNSTNNKHENTIFIIEIAVLTIFCFACLGVIIASLCLLKMRQSSSKMLSKHGNASKIRQRPSSSNNNKKKEKHKSFQYELSASLGILLQNIHINHILILMIIAQIINIHPNIYEYESNNDSHNKLVLVMDCEFGNYVCYELKIVYELKIKYLNFYLVVKNAAVHDSSQKDTHVQFFNWVHSCLNKDENNLKLHQ